MTDQQRFDALGANGGTLMRTPNLDRLAEAGVNLGRYYTNAPVCVVSRCTLFTGRYPHAHRVRENHNLLEYGREMHLFRVLRQAGYSLGYSGKNHLLEADELKNFDYVNADPKDGAALKEWYQNYRKALADDGMPETWRAGTFHDFPDEETRTWKTAAGGLEYLRERPKDQPFCLCVSFSDPHVPHLAPRRFEKDYPVDEMEPYPARDGELQDKARRFEIKHLAQKSDRADESGIRKYLSVYRAMISFVDEQVGALLDELTEQGIEEETIVVFTSDHGEFAFEHGLYKKDLVLLDSLLHVPFLLRWPGRLEPARVDSTMMEEVDVVPTLLDLAGLEIPFGVQGKSFAPVLRGDETSHKDAVFGEICPPWLFNRFRTYEEFEAHHGSWEATPMNIPGDSNKSVREEGYRYTWYGTGEEELYDHSSDPDESINVANDPGYAEVKLRLKLRLFEWAILTEDPLDPLSIRQNQKKYDNWQGGEPLPGVMAGPGWLEERFRPNPLDPWNNGNGNGIDASKSPVQDLAT